LGALALAAIGWIGFLVRAETADASETRDNLQMAQLTESDSATSGDAKLELTVASPSAITPAQPANLTARLTDLNGTPIKDVYFEVSIVQIEDDKTVFATGTDATDGQFSWGHDFWDGTEHTVKIVASPAAGAAAQFQPVTLEHVVPVTALAPP